MKIAIECDYLGDTLVDLVLSNDPRRQTVWLGRMPCER
jgi:hypothetical protein